VRTRLSTTTWIEIEDWQGRSEFDIEANPELDHPQKRRELDVYAYC
jgi:hypothetical protein